MAKGNIQTLNATNNPTSLIPGADGLFLKADSSAATGLSWGAVASLSQVYPIGCIYTSTVGTDPGTVFGFGTWTAFGTGRVLVGYDAGDPNFDTAEETGGAKTVASAGSNSAPTMSGSTASESTHTHGVTSNVAVANHTFTQPTVSWPAGVPALTGSSATTSATSAGTPAGTNSTPTFTGNAVTAASTAAGTKLVTGNTSTGVSPVTTATGSVSAPTFTGSALATHTHTLTATGTIAWPAGVPTNASGAVDAHAVTNNAVTSAAGSSHLHAVGTLAASAPTFTGSLTSVLQPYITVFFFKRTA